MNESLADSGFTFGDPRFPTCCGKPVGCTNIADTCPYREHKWKREYIEDHPRPLDPEGEHHGWRERADSGETSSPQKKESTDE